MDAEQAVIGCMLLENQQTNLKPEMFHDALLGKLFWAIQNGATDDVLLRDAISKDEYPDDIFYYVLNQCINLPVLSIEIEKYASIVRKQWVEDEKNRIISHGELSASEMADRLASLDASKDGATGKDVVERYAPTMFKDGRYQGIKTGISKIDEILGSMRQGNVTIIAARPGVGKSAISTEIARNILKAGMGVNYYSLEMTEEEVYQRFLSRESRIPLKRVMYAKAFLHDEQKRFDDANAEISKWKLKIFDDVFKVSEMKCDTDILMIDYAQLIQPESEYRGNRYAEVGDISKSLKRKAKKYKIPILVLCQLNRGSDEFTEPNMSELRESGDFEQDASQIILLWNTSEDRTTKGFKVDKNRSGERGKGELHFDGSRMSFDEFAEIDDMDNPFS